MASLIPGFEYDIFISYRQKDNEYDGWVTEFVNNLRRELNATFKDEVSIYFDANPSDGLLENYSVRESLIKKLRCLIFIPVISQTYCDPKSYAWQNELCSFKDYSDKDEFGRNIVLQGGNVTSRILPVKIHELDFEDKMLLENELGGVLRSVDFIYKSSGVNRPLRSFEDHPNDNLNKTYYRDQINKVANAIKEIINALRKPDTSFSFHIPEKELYTPHKRNTWPLKISVIVIAALLIAGYFIIPRTSVASGSVDKSIAVLPFINDSHDQENTHFIDGIMEEILHNLQAIKDLRVISRTSVEQFREQKRSISKISKELNVNYIVQGSAQIYGNKLRLRVQLIRSDKEKQLLNLPYDMELKEANDLFSIQSEIAQSIATKLEAAITPNEKIIINKKPTNDLGALNDFLQGQFFWRKLTHNDLDSAMKYFESAKKKDPSFALSYAGISDAWIALGQLGFISPETAGVNASAALIKALELDSTLAQIHYSLALVMYAVKWDWKGSEAEFQKSLIINPNNAEARSHYSNLLDITGRVNEAKQQIEMANRLDPYNPLIKSLYALHLLFTSEYDKAIDESKEALLLDQTNPVALFANAYALHATGNYGAALIIWKTAYFNTYKGFKKISHAFDKGYARGGYKAALKSEADTLAKQLGKGYYNPTDISTLYLAAGENKKALEFMVKAYKVHDQNAIYVKLPLYDGLRNEVRFQELCKKMNLPIR